MKFEKIRKLEKATQGYRQKLSKEKDPIKRQQLQIKCSINDLKIKMEKLKKN